MAIERNVTGQVLEQGRSTADESRWLLENLDRADEMFSGEATWHVRDRLDAQYARETFGVDLQANEHHGPRAPSPAGGLNQVWGVLQARRRNAAPDELPEINRDLRRVLVLMIILCVVAVVWAVVTIR